MYSLKNTVKTALRLAWTQKKLWILSALLVMGGMGSMNFDPSEDKSEVDNIPRSNSNIQKIVKRDFSEVALSLATAENPLTPTFPEDAPLIDSVSVEEDQVKPMRFDAPEVDFDKFYTFLMLYKANMVLLGFAFLLLIVMGVGVNFLVKSWATGALLKGAEAALKGESYSLGDLGTYGRQSARKLFYYWIYLGVLSLLVVLIAGVGAMLNLDLGALLIVLVLSVAVLFGNLFGLRFAALTDMPYKSSLKEGLLVFKNNFFKAIILAIVNCFVYGLTFILVLGGFLGSLGAFFVLTSFAPESSVVIILTGTMLALGVIVVVLILSVLWAYLKTYSTFTWSIFYNNAITHKRYKINGEVSDE